ncbi:hypothetical protein FJZ28_02155 [Candidatus Peregrinibacteria bacterium]|nr:hypothetical protein [Candidatus Peregrinibacteria bacterium]
MLSQVADYDIALALDWLSTTPKEPGPIRIRKIILRATLAVAALLSADTARVIMCREKPQSCAVAPQLSLPLDVDSLTRDTPIPELFDALRNPKDASAFLRKHIQSETPQSPAAFTGTFRDSTTKFLGRGTGCCNNYAQFWADLWESTGRKSYLVSMWPTEEHRNRSRGEGFKSKNSWHMVAAYSRMDPSTGRQEYMIGDNDSYLIWEKSLEEYAHSKGMSILPIGGIQRFTPVNDAHDFRAKIWDLCSANSIPEVSDEPAVRDIVVAAMR